MLKTPDKFKWSTLFIFVYSDLTVIICLLYSYHLPYTRFCWVSGCYLHYLNYEDDVCYLADLSVLFGLLILVCHIWIIEFLSAIELIYLISYNFLLLFVLFYLYYLCLFSSLFSYQVLALDYYLFYLTYWACACYLTCLLSVYNTSIIFVGYSIIKLEKLNH